MSMCEKKGKTYPSIQLLKMLELAVSNAPERASVDSEARTNQIHESTLTIDTIRLQLHWRTLRTSTIAIFGDTPT